MDTDEAAAACVPKKCPPEGDGILPDTRVDGIHCCFKGQAWAKSQNKCVGKPTQCPEDSGYGVIDGREGCYTAGERRLAAHDDERKKSMSQIHHVTAILVHAPPSKPNGKPWDVPGADEPPDLFVAVAQGGRQLGASQVVRNSFDATFKVNMTIDPKNGPLTIRVLDKDLMNDDFVAEVTADFGAGAAGKHLFADGQGYVQIVESAARQE
jgi:hypothetical protein